MTGDTILLIGIDDKKVNLGQIYEPDRYSRLQELYGEESIFLEPYRLLTEDFEAESVSVLNLDSWDDLREEPELFQQQEFTYIVPLDLRLSDSYDDIFENKRYYYVQLLVWMTYFTPSTVIVTGLHARLFNTLTEYLEYEEKEIDTITGSLSNLRKNNLIYVSNGLRNFSRANVVLAGALLNDIAEYPLPDNLGEAYWDMDYSDINTDLVWFCNHYLRETTIENLKNFAEDPFIKSVLVDRIIKWLKRHWPDQHEYIGTAFSDYKLVKIAEQMDEFLKSLVDWIIYDYRILSVSTEQHADSTIGIHIHYEIWPKFTTEKYVDEVVL